MVCDKCKKQNVCNKPCKRVEQYLRENGIFGKDWMRHKMPNKKRKNGYQYGEWREIPFSSLSDIDQDKNPYLTRDIEVG